MTSPTRYERITYKPEGAKRARSVILEGVSESDALLSGTEVDRHGEYVGTLEVSRRLHVIDKTLVKRRVPLRLSLKYGEMEEVAP